MSVVMAYAAGYHRAGDLDCSSPVHPCLNTSVTVNQWNQWPLGHCKAPSWHHHHSHQSATWYKYFCIRLCSVYLHIRSKSCVVSCIQYPAPVALPPDVRETRQFPLANRMARFCHTQRADESSFSWRRRQTTSGPNFHPTTGDHGPPVSPPSSPSRSGHLPIPVARPQPTRPTPARDPTG